MLRVMPPPPQISGVVTAGVPPLTATTLADPQQRMLAERGRYLFMVASCALCHLPNGAGGAKICWKPFGSLWTRNITPDPDMGIGRWSDVEIGRAFRNGVTPDGRTLHWPGMIWDHASNWDEEDIRAVIAYLRILPPVQRRIPSATPPSPDDCAIYTFWTSQSLRPGCH